MFMLRNRAPGRFTAGGARKGAERRRQVAIEDAEKAMARRMGKRTRPSRAAGKARHAGKPERQDCSGASTPPASDEPAHQGRVGRVYGAGGGGQGHRLSMVDRPASTPPTRTNPRRRKRNGKCPNPAPKCRNCCQTTPRARRTMAGRLSVKQEAQPMGESLAPDGPPQAARKAERPPEPMRGSQGARTRSARRLRD